MLNQLISNRISIRTKIVFNKLLQQSTEHMNLSSNSLFHFTGKIGILKKILNDKLYGSYCKETFNIQGTLENLYIPKISFCDIPLKTISNYSSYGKYGIGLKKEWGIKNKLNPVVYLEKNSLLFESLLIAIKSHNGVLSAITATLNNHDLIRQYISSNVESINETQRNNILYEMLDINSKLKDVMNTIKYNSYSLYHTKHYEDKLVRSNKTKPKYRFYDEREWCFVPEINGRDPLLITEEEYIKWRNTKSSKPLIEDLNLSFNAHDIQHIIVAKESEIPKMISIIKKLNTTKYTEADKELLFTKIVSFERLKNDF